MNSIFNRLFRYGWKRKVVHRAKGTGIDIYYRAQDNKKLRSTRKVHEYLDPRSRLKIHHFTFARKPLGLDCSKEVCRRIRNPGVPDDAINIIEEQAVGLGIEEQNPIDIQPAVVRNPGVPDDSINIIEEQAVGLDIEEQNPIDIQPEVVNNHDGAAIDKNKIEEQTMEFDVEEKNENNVESCPTSTAETPESDENSSSETTMFHECNGRRYHFRKETDEENQIIIDFINDITTKEEQ